jgi:O-antigen/teichoic acid export membrane protein
MSEPKRNSLLVSMMSNWTTMLLAVVVGFFLTSYIIRELGKTGFGIWILMSSLVGYYGILDLGVESAVTRYVARYASKKDYKSLNRVVSTALMLFCVIGFVIAILSVSFDAVLADFFDVEAALRGDFQSLVVILGFSIAVSFPGNMLSAVIKAHERFFEANLVDIVTIVLRTALVIYLLEEGHGLVGLAYANLFSAAVMLGLNFYYCHRLFPHIKLNFNHAHWATLGTLMAFGVGAATQEISSVLRFDLDSFVIGKWIGLEAVGLYGVAALLMRYYLQFISSATISVFTPRFSHIAGRGEYDKLLQIFLKSLVIGSFLSFALGSSLFILSQSFITIWAGSDFLEVLPILWLLCVAYAVTLAQSTSVAIMYALKKHQLFAVISLIEGVVNLSLSIYLAPKYGMLGVAWGTVIPMLFVKILLQPWYIAHIMHISLWTYLKGILPPFFLAILLVGSAWYIPTLMPSDLHYIGLVVWGSLICLSFAGLYLLLYADDRRMIFKKIQARF